ncbi:Neutral protease 2 [Penicillium taxi]|uniref:Neutral protease 2 n=1 Tax=Penicillium taxi TaxID=168475 RepID=UPI0025450939|nr:Neutral protease 2 [Penicillium taxi]KAJ5901984.1 Neutral protease 2 [Penicillium taxi]
MAFIDDIMHAELREDSSASPKMIFCDEAFKYGGNDRDYGGFSAVACSTIGNKLSEKMETLGTKLLHMYTH